MLGREEQLLLELFTWSYLVKDNKQTKYSIKPVLGVPPADIFNYKIVFSSSNICSSLWAILPQECRQRPPGDRKECLTDIFISPCRQEFLRSNSNNLCRGCEQSNVSGIQIRQVLLKWTINRNNHLINHAITMLLNPIDRNGKGGGSQCTPPKV